MKIVFEAKTSSLGKADASIKIEKANFADILASAKCFIDSIIEPLPTEKALLLMNGIIEHLIEKAFELTEQDL